MNKLFTALVIAGCLLLAPLAKAQSWTQCPRIPTDEITQFGMNSNVDLTFMVHVNEKGELEYWAYLTEPHVVRADGVYKGIPAYKSGFRKFIETLGEGSGDGYEPPASRRWR